MAYKTTIKIFIASSNELIKERKNCILIINQLNKSHKHLVLEPVEWEYDLIHSNYPEHKNIQAAINPLLKECTLGVFIFYSKIGKYTKEEFEYANAENKKLFTFFKLGFSPKKHELVAYSNLLEFKESLNDILLYKEYTDLDDFEKQFYSTLNLYLSESHKIIISKEGNSTSLTLSQSNLELVKLLVEKEREIKELKEGLNQLPDSSIQLQELIKEKEIIKNQLLQTEEIKKQLAKDKKDLENQLAPQKAKDNLKAKALEEIKKGNYTEAEFYLKESAKESINEAASTFYELGKIKNIQLQFSEAFKYYEIAVKINPDNSLYLNEAGILARKLGFYNQSIDYHEKSINIKKRELPENAPELATSYNNLALAFENKGEYNKAIDFLEKALIIDKLNQGEKHISISIRYNNLGTIYDSIGQYDKAIDYYERALKIGVEIMGEDYPEIAIRYSNLGLAYSQKGDFKKAIEYQEKVLSLDKKNYGEGHPNLATDYNLGLSYIDMGEYDSAINYLETAIEIGKKFIGEEHPDIAIRYGNIAIAYKRKKQYNKAIEYFRKSLIIGKKFLGDEHPSIGNRYNNLGTVYLEKKEYTKASKYFEKALLILRKFFDPLHPRVKTASDNLEKVQKLIEKNKSN